MSKTSNWWVSWNCFFGQTYLLSRSYSKMFCFLRMWILTQTYIIHTHKIHWIFWTVQISLLWKRIDNKFSLLYYSSVWWMMKDTNHSSGSYKLIGTMELRKTFVFYELLSIFGKSNFRSFFVMFETKYLASDYITFAKFEYNYCRYVILTFCLHQWGI